LIRRLRRQNKMEKKLPKATKRIKKAVPEKTEVLKQEAADKAERYFGGEGRRKTAVARVRLFTKGDKSFLVNQKPLEKYFYTAEFQQIAKSALDGMNCLDKFTISVVVRGGGMHAQAEAVRHGITKALVLFNVDFRKRLKKLGYLTRDARMRERKKFGLKRARRAPQWQKR